MTNNVALNFWKDLSPEAKLLIKSSRLSFNEDQREEIKLLINEVKDWKLFQKLALQTSLAPLCFKSLVTSGHYDIPEETASFLKRVYTKILAQNIPILDEYDRLKVILDQAEIPYVPLKGVRLIGKYYKDAGLRNISDVDLLFRKRDLEAVRKLMKVNEYKEYIVGEYQLISELTQNPSPYQYYKNNVSIDFHILLNRVGKISLNIADYWSSAIKKEDSFEFALNPNLEFIHLCYHLYKHLNGNDNKLIWLTDLCLFIEREQIDWEKIKNYSEEYKCWNELLGIVKLIEIVSEKSILPVDYLKYESICIEGLILNYQNNFINSVSTIRNLGLSKQLFFETEHLSPIQKIVVALGRLFPSKAFLESRYGRVDNYFLVMIKRYLVYLKR
jgi:hypothetical protein